MSYVDNEGFHLTPVRERLANLKATAQGIFGSGIDVSPDSPDGRMLALYANAIFEADSNLAAIHAARSPSVATGAQLARISLINGVKKNNPEPSTGVVTLSGVPGTVIPSGSLIANSVDATAVFETVGDATIGGGGSVVGVSIESQSPGAIPGLSGDLTVIQTVISGWTGVVNPADVVLGNLGESDPALRARRAASVALPSQGLVDGLYAALLQGPTLDHLGGGGCSQALVLENPLDTTVTLADSTTLPPHSIEVITLGGLSADIAQTIWIKKAPGCSMVGGTSLSVTDSQGFPHTIKWDPATAVPIYVVIHTPTPLSGTVQSAIQAAFQAWGAGLLQTDGTILVSGQEPSGTVLPGPKIGGVQPGGAGTQGYVMWSQMFVPINALLASNPTLFVTSIDIGTAPSPTLQNNIALNHDAIADFSDTAKITFP